jgi:hypothetical protein
MLVSAVSGSLQAMNILRPYDTLIRPPFKLDSTSHISIYAQHGFNARGYNDNGSTNNVLRIWNEHQDALKMLQGFNPNSEKGLLAANLRADTANDDGVRGHYCVDGQLYFNAMAFDFRYHFLRTWFFTVYLPLYDMRLKNVSWHNLTKDVSSGDRSVREKLTDNFFENVRQLGDGLELCGWDRLGLGDLTVLMEWIDDFPQAKPLLKNMRVNWRLGATFPTGLRVDEDLIFALPFGADGAFGVIAGVGLDATLGCNLRTGVDVQIYHQFGNTRLRRIKTDADQTELLLLQKVCAYKDFGLTQRYNLYLEGFNFGGFSLKVGYQFFKHGDDYLSLKTEEFSDNIANTAVSLQEWTMHHVVVNASYDFSAHLREDAPAKPYLSLFSYIPTNGKRVALCPNIGAILAFDF